MNAEILDRLAVTLEARKQADPQSSYVARLYAKGLDAILKKVAEEAAETIMAAKDGVREKIIYETADLWFHSLVLLAQQGIGKRSWPSWRAARACRASRKRRRVVTVPCTRRSIHEQCRVHLL